MSDLEIVDLGASRLDESSGAIVGQAKGAPIDEAEDEAPSYGDAPIMCALGIAARPAPANERGSAQGIATQVGGLDGVVLAAHDPRAAKAYGEIQPGETAVFATGEAFDARALFKDKLIALVVGDDMVVTVDGRKGQKKIALSCPGGIFQISERDGVSVCDASGKAALRLDGGTAALLGQVILGGGAPKGPLADAQKITAELGKIAAAIAQASATMVGGVVYVPGDVSAPGVFCGT